jgi:Rieske Fe-S protein
MPSNDEASTQSPAVGRRWLLSGGVGIAATVVLAGCGGDREPADAGTTTPSEAEPGSGGDTGSGTGTELGPVSEVAVGGGVIFPDQEVVVTQPTEGEFRAFDTTCTHAGCQVDAVTETINCPCHGSTFSLEDGSVVSGPATAPLATKSVAVEGATLRLG